MSLLRKIQDDCASGEVELSTILRHCRILASRLGSEGLEQWLHWESDGYPDENTPPNYRRLTHVLVQGHFVGAFGAQMRNAEIPPEHIPVAIRSACTSQDFRQGIAVLEDTAEHQSGTLKSLIPVSAAQIFEPVFLDMQCISAWKMIPGMTIPRILNTVRNRVLDFALNIEKEFPDAGEDAAKHSTSDQSRFQQIFNTTVYGGAANIVGQASRSNIAATNVATGDWNSLRDALKALEASAADIKDLKNALDHEKKPPGRDRFGPKVAGWIGKMATKSASGTWKIASGLALNILTRLISEYYGIDG